MKKYIVLDGVTYELVRRTEKGIVATADLTGKIKLSDIPVGETLPSEATTTSMAPARIGSARSLEPRSPALCVPKTSSNTPWI